MDPVTDPDPIEPPDSVVPTRRVTFICAFFPPVGGIGGLRVAKLSKYLPGFGWACTVLCSDEADPELLDRSLLDDVPAETVVIRVAGPARMLGGLTGTATRAWRAGQARGAIGLVKAIVGAFVVPDRWIGWSLRVGRLPRATYGEPDVIVSSGPPHSSHLAAARVARRLGRPFVMDLRDDWFGNPMTRSWAPWRATIDRLLERYCMARASRIIVVSEASRVALMARHPAVAGKVLAVPNGFDPTDFVSETPPGAGPVDRHDVLFAGTLRKEQTVGRFFEAFGGLARAIGPSLRLTFLGVVDHAHLDAARREVPPASLRVLPPVDHRAAITMMRSAGALLVFTGGGGAGPDTMTGKLYEYLAARRPVLVVGPAGPAPDLVLGARAGVAADPWDIEALRNALVTTQESGSQATFSGAPDEVLRRFDRRHLACRWATVLGALIDGGSGVVDRPEPC